MIAGTNIWSRIETAMIVVKFTSLDELKKYREAIVEEGLNVNNCELIAIVDSKKQREALSTNSLAVFVTDKDVNLVGQLKNPLAQKAFARKYDVLLLIEDAPGKVRKWLKRAKFTLSVGLNCTSNEQNVNIETIERTPRHLINFARKTLEKII